eukprot:4339077-Prymnesium_polylepis.1
MWRPHTCLRPTYCTPGHVAWRDYGVTAVLRRTGVTCSRYRVVTTHPRAITHLSLAREPFLVIPLDIPQQSLPLGS